MELLAREGWMDHLFILLSIEQMNYCVYRQCFWLKPYTGSFNAISFPCKNQYRFCCKPIHHTQGGKLCCHWVVLSAPPQTWLSGASSDKVQLWEASENFHQRNLLKRQSFSVLGVQCSAVCTFFYISWIFGDVFNGQTMFESPLSQMSVAGNLQEEWRTDRNCSYLLWRPTFWILLTEAEKTLAFLSMCSACLANITLSEPILAGLLFLKMGSLLTSFFRSAIFFCTNLKRSNIVLRRRSE